MSKPTKSPDRILPKCSEEICPECGQANDHLKDHIQLQFFDIYDQSPVLSLFDVQIPGE